MTAFRVAYRLFGIVFLISAAGRLWADERVEHFEPNDKTGACSAVLVDDCPLVHTRQFFAADSEGGALPKDAARQFELALDRLDAALKQAGARLADAVKLNVYIASSDLAPKIDDVLARRFSGPNKPAVATVATPLPQAGALVAVDAVAVGPSENRRSVTRGADAAVCPKGARIYISGQAERDQSLAAATRKTLHSLRDTLEFLDRSDSDIVHIKAFVSPIADADVVRKEVADFFGDQASAPLTLVEWESRADVPIEIEMVAWGGRSQEGDPIEYLTPPDMKASPVFSRVARVNGGPTIYTSGIHGVVNNGADPSAEREVKKAFASLGRILKLAGSDFRHLLKATYYVSSDECSATLNELRPQYYDPKRPPAASKAKVADVGRPKAGLMMDMIAAPSVDAEAE